MDYDYDAYAGDVEEYEYRSVQEEEEDDYDYDPDSMTLEELLFQCIRPTLTQTFRLLLKLLIWNFIFRLSTQVISIPRLIQHAFSTLCGVLCLYSIFPENFLLLLIFPTLCYFPVRCLKNRGAVSLVLSGAFLLYCELWWLEPRLWHQIRGSQMVLIMKVVSLAYDLDLGLLKDVPGVIAYYGYMFCPGNSVFGPWTSFLDYEHIFKQPKWRLSWLRHLVYSAFFALLFLTISTCWVYYVFPDSSWKWVMAYRNSLSFRCSHYFVSYASEVTLLLSGFVRLRHEDGVAVARPWTIEVPRSLIQVAVSWNLPMHSWLKIYVFNTTLRYGNFVAVLSTYAGSALLHGLNFQLAAVLLSLGFYSYVEYMLRKKLASIFSACILARPCKPDCTHTHKWNQPSVVGVNIFFMLLALLHLAYLAVMFHDAESSETGYSYEHTINEWSKLGFLSHYIALFTYVVYFLI